MQYLVCQNLLSLIAFYFTDKTFTGLDYMSNTTSVLQEAVTADRSRTSGFTPDCFGGVRVTHQFIFLCCVACFIICLFVFVLSLVYSMLSVLHQCPFLIAPSVFSNVYFNLNTKRQTHTHLTFQLNILFGVYSTAHVRVVSVLLFPLHANVRREIPKIYTFSRRMKERL